MAFLLWEKVQKILNPEKTVLLPDPTADCPMAHMVTAEKILEMRARYQDDLAVVCYINSTAQLKQYADVCVTSANAMKIVRNLPQSYIYFIPRRKSGPVYRQTSTGKTLYLQRRLLSSPCANHRPAGAKKPKHSIQMP